MWLHGGMLKPYSSVGVLAAIVFLCCLYGLAITEPLPANSGWPIHLSWLWGPGLLAAPFAIGTCFDLVSSQRLRSQPILWARITLGCDFFGFAGLALRAKVEEIEAKWPLPLVEEPFYSFAPWLSGWSVFAGCLIAVGLLGVILCGCTARRV